jgi:hypothetical protein
VEYQKDAQDQADKARGVVPFQLLAQVQDRNNGEYRKRDHFLNGPELGELGGEELIRSDTVFKDSLALSITKPGFPPNARVCPGKLRAFLAVRSRYAEDQLAAALAQVCANHVLLGTGLDTFAYRDPCAELGLRVFEVDHPATQVSKRDLLRGWNPGRAGVCVGGFRTADPAFIACKVVVSILVKRHVSHGWA